MLAVGAEIFPKRTKDIQNHRDVPFIGVAGTLPV